MPAIKPLDRISSKWARVSGLSQESYREGVENPTRDWASATAAAEDNYNKGVQAAIAAKRFGKGVRKAGTAKWQANAIAKGPDRWGQGIRLSENAYQEGFAPFRETILNTKLPERGPKGDPKNIERVRVMAEALHAKKIALAGA